MNNLSNTIPEMLELKCNIEINSVEGGRKYDQRRNKRKEKKIKIGDRAGGESSPFQPWLFFFYFCWLKGNFWISRKNSFLFWFSSCFISFFNNNEQFLCTNTWTIECEWCQWVSVKTASGRIGSMMWIRPFVLSTFERSTENGLIRVLYT